MTTEPLLKPQEVAKLLGISVTSLNRAWRDGTGPEYVTLGSQTRRCTHTAVQTYIEQLKGSNE